MKIRMGILTMILLGSIVVLAEPAATELSASAGEAGDSPPTTASSSGSTQTPGTQAAEPASPSCNGIAASIPDASDAVLNEHVNELLISGSSSSPSTDASQERLLAVVPSATAGSISFFKVESDGMLQVVGTAPRPGRYEVSFDHTLLCDTTASFNLEVYEDGSASISILHRDSSVQTVGIASPWAIDSEGRTVQTWYEVRAERLIQIIDGHAATGAITFDPTYTTLSCVGHYSDQDAFFYLNMWQSDPGYCPVMGMFNSPATNNYSPVWGWEANVANDYGKIAIKQGGDCSWGPDTGWAWDFQVPCKAHDYCYDLRKAGFSGTVTDGECDHWLYWLMEAHCNDRFFAFDCRLIRDSYKTAVSLPGVVTNPNPGLVEIRSRMTGKCADIEGASSADNTPIQQWSCVGVSNQRYKIWPAPNAPGYFHIKPSHSNMCARALTDPVQWSCVNTWDSERFRIQGALNQNQYSIRSKHHQNECWKVPLSWSNSTDLVDPVCDDYNNWYIWRIVDV